MKLTSDRALLIATDIDGTLLDHDAQLPFPAHAWRIAIQQLAARLARCTVAFASSRTLVELLVLQRALGVRGPCIAEDGAVLALDVDDATDARLAHLPPDDTLTFGRRTVHIWTRAQRTSSLRAIMSDINAVQRADASRLDQAALSALGFRTTGAIRRALHARHHSLLLDPTRLFGDEASAIRRAAAVRGLQLRRGGRWLTLADTTGKGTALAMLRHFQNLCGVSPFVVAIGNEENDLSLLQKADLAFVIHNPGRGPHPALASISDAVVLDSEGPGGWLDMLNHLQELVQ
ncbi:HAD hydrolase family protein [Gemmatimonas sp.]|uniref:HAD hydrolase family protein n=1 Tax=Gemmatimonas sp. TaxID=1962908 RepID=UPI0039832ED7